MSGSPPDHRRGELRVYPGAAPGVGLAIARGFVDAMRGELTLDDTPGGGVTMVVSLPEAAW